MDLDQIREILSVATELRPPRASTDPKGARVSALEDYLLESAWHHAELEEARQRCRRLRDVLLTEWQQLQGYEVMLPSKPSARMTEADINRAKAKTSPVLYESGQEAKRLLEDIERQIDRFEFEKEVCSRVYTMIAG